jgi:ABC-type uncharacterized transport system ATPase subunit
MTSAMASGQTASNIVEMRGIVKRFGEVIANAEVDFDLRHGEIHALLGENGAGKTTLMNILYGLLHPDSGTISIDRHPISLRSPEDAIAFGIGMVHQHFMLVPTLTVVENIILGEKKPLLLRNASLQEIIARLNELGQRYGLSVPATARMWELSVGEQQRVEILRALHRNARILILDEPTASLAPAEIEQLLSKLRAMARDGSSIVIITHHLDEVMRWADRITVLRHGTAVATLQPSETDREELARLMVGRNVSLVPVLTATSERPPTNGGATAYGEEVLVVERLGVVGDRGKSAIRDASFRVRRGEIVAIAGVEGNGQAELEEVLLGLRRANAGTISVLGRDAGRARPLDLLRLGVAFVPSDRFRRGVIRELSVAENLVLDKIDQPPLGGRISLRTKEIIARAAELIRKFSIVVRNPMQKVSTLSGGNAQRVVLARAFSGQVKLVVAAQPTRGLDVGAIEFVWSQLRSHRDDGVGIVLISGDLDEVLALADRCYVLYRGRLVVDLSRTDFDRNRIGLAMGGGHAPSSNESGR